MWLATCSSFPHSSAVMDALTEVCEAVVIDMSAQVLRIHLVIVTLVELIIVSLTSGMIGFGFDILAGVCLVVDIALVIIFVVIIFGLVVLLSCA